MDCSPPAPLSRDFFPKEYWSRLPFPPPRDLPDPGIEHETPLLAGKFFATEPSGKPHVSLLRTEDIGVLRGPYFHG